MKKIKLPVEVTPIPVIKQICFNRDLKFLNNFRDIVFSILLKSCPPVEDLFKETI